MTREDGVDNHGNVDLTHLPSSDGDHATSLPPPNIVTIHHDDDAYSVSAHVKTNSITAAGIAIGDRVTAGQKIGEVGNNDGSSEPHLHVAYWVYTDEGWERTLPMRFNGLSDADGNPVTTTPRDGFRGVA